MIRRLSEVGLGVVLFAAMLGSPALAVGAFYGALAWLFGLVLDVAACPRCD